MAPLYEHQPHLIQQFEWNEHEMTQNEPISASPDATTRSWYAKSFPSRKDGPFSEVGRGVPTAEGGRFVSVI